MGLVALQVEESDQSLPSLSPTWAHSLKISASQAEGSHKERNLPGFDLGLASLENLEK